MNPMYAHVSLTCSSITDKTQPHQIAYFGRVKPPNGVDSLSQVHVYLKCIEINEYVLSFENPYRRSLAPDPLPFWNHIDKLTRRLQVVKLKIDTPYLEHRLIKWLKKHPELRCIHLTCLDSSDMTHFLLEQLTQMPCLAYLTLYGQGAISKTHVLALAKNPSLTQLNLEMALKPALQVEELNALLPLLPNIQHMAVIAHTDSRQRLTTPLHSLWMHWQSGTKLKFDASALTSLRIGKLTRRKIPWMEMPTQLTQLKLREWRVHSVDHWPTFFETLPALTALTDLQLPLCRPPSFLVAAYMAYNTTLTTLDVGSMLWNTDFDELGWLLTNTTLTTFHFPQFTPVEEGPTTLPTTTSNAWLQFLLECNTSLTRLALPPWQRVPLLGGWTTTLLRFEGDKRQLYWNRVRHTSLLDFCLPRKRNIWKRDAAVDVVVESFSKQ